MSLSSIHGMLYICAEFMSILVHLIIFIMMLERILLAENFANLATLLESTTKNVPVEAY